MKILPAYFITLIATLLAPGCRKSAPEADFSLSAETIQAHQSITFTDMSTEAPDTWQWTFSGANTQEATRPTVTVRYDVPGTYPVSLTVSNRYGFSTTTKTVRVLAAENTFDFWFLLVGGLGTRLRENPKKVAFTRFADLGSNGDVHLVSRTDGSWQAYAYTSMTEQLYAHGANLNPATWMGKDGSWIVVFDDDNYISSGIPDYVLDELVKLTNKGHRFRRIDQDNQGRFTILTDKTWVSWSNTGINSVLNNQIVSFAFGETFWAAISAHDYWIVHNSASSSLESKLAQLKQDNYEFVDLEIGDYGWVLVYR